MASPSWCRRTSLAILFAKTLVAWGGADGVWVSSSAGALGLSMRLVPTTPSCRWAPPSRFFARTSVVGGGFGDVWMVVAYAVMVQAAAAAGGMPGVEVVARPRRCTSPSRTPARASVVGGGIGGPWRHLPVASPWPWAGLLAGQVLRVAVVPGATCSMVSSP